MKNDTTGTGAARTLTLTEPQWMAVHEALGQYVENGEDAAELDGRWARLDAASDVLDAMDSTLAALAIRTTEGKCS